MYICYIFQDKLRKYKEIVTQNRLIYIIRDIEKTRGKYRRQYDDNIKIYEDYCDNVTFYDDIFSILLQNSLLGIYIYIYTYKY